MCDRFTERARKVMSLARDKAVEFRHDYIGPEHILLGLLEVDTGVHRIVFSNLDIDPLRILRELEKLMTKGSADIGLAQLPFTPAGKLVLELCAEEAHYLNHNYIGTEHILLALIQVDDGLVSNILKNVGITAEVVRLEILTILGGEPPKFPPPSAIRKPLKFPPPSAIKKPPNRFLLLTPLIVGLILVVVAILIVTSGKKAEKPIRDETLPKGFAPYCRSIFIYPERILAIEETDNGVVLVLNMSDVPEILEHWVKSLPERVINSLITYAKQKGVDIRKNSDAVFIELKNRDGKTIGKGVYRGESGLEFKWE